MHQMLNIEQEECINIAQQQDKNNWSNIHFQISELTNSHTVSNHFIFLKVPKKMAKYLKVNTLYNK